MEHGAFDMKELRDFMRGLVDAGPTRTGHRTPAVIVTLPILGKDPAAMRANYWVAQQVMAAGVHGILLCHAENPEAVKIFVESLRYPFAEKHAGLDTGIRGNGSQNFASQIWGLPPNEYMLKADMWPLNKNGEVLLGLKIETPMAAENAEKTTRDSRYRLCRMGTGRSKLLPRRPSYRRRPRRPARIASGDEESARAHLQGRQSREPVLSELLQRTERHRHDQGRRDDLHRRRHAGGGEGTSI